MNTYNAIVSEFTKEIEAEVSQILDEVGFEIFWNIREKQTNSGKSVNSLLLPADTTGATGESIRIQSETNVSGANIALVGRKGIMNLDKGNPPAESSGEWSNFDDFYYAIKDWARAKERRYGLEPNEINAYSVASHVWLYGSVLWRAGGGTESIRDLLPPAVEKIDGKITELIEKFASDIVETITTIQE